MTPTSISVCGASGSIGTQTLDVVRAEPDRYVVHALGVARSIDLVVAQAAEFRPRVVAVADVDAAATLGDRLPAGTELRAGPNALESIAAEADIAVNGVVGFAGLGVTLGAIRAGKRLALANKESLIAGGPVVRAALASHPDAHIVPVDSEHCALHQALRAGAEPREVARLLLTASGGPFRGRSNAELEEVTVEAALQHPTWSMGPKITVDSSTLMNKGLEVIEAKELFDIDVDRIDVVVHPQSIVHSMVEFTDGATIAQLSMPDMRLPIAYALAWPQRSSVPVGRIDWTTMSRLDFEPPDRKTFPCLDLCYEAATIGGTAPAWLNGANEVVVDAFLQGVLPWIVIADVLKEALGRHHGEVPTTVDDVIDADRRGRVAARDAISRRA